jgi:hypothetical protein
MRFFQMPHVLSLTWPEKIVDHISMVKLVQHKKSPLINVKSIVEIVDIADSGQIDLWFGCSPYPNVGCTQFAVDEPEGQPTAWREEKKMKQEG